MRIVKYIGGGAPKSEQELWGGTIATNHAFLKAFRDDQDYQIVAEFRRTFLTGSKADRPFERVSLRAVEDFIEGADIVHVDDTSIAAAMLLGGVVPDVIGPITRSPIKDYGDSWTCPYAHLAEQFYSAEVIRLSYGGEVGAEDKVTLIRHGVDLERLRPNRSKTRKYILWAGNKRRTTKNYDLFEAIAQLPPPEGYEWKSMSGYRVGDYWDALDETALLVNTSVSESFCAAMAEARAKGVPVVYRRGLHGPSVQEDGRIMVDYTVEAYRDAISGLLADPAYLEAEGRESRKYAEANFSFRNMRDDIAVVYDRVLSRA